MEELSLPANCDSLPKALAFMNRRLDSAGFFGNSRSIIEMCLEEIFVNIASYAYGHDVGPVTLCVDTLPVPPSVILRFLDRGVPYNPLEKPDPDIHAPLRDRKRGGLGIFMVKKYMHEVKYQYQDGQNILTMKMLL